jgi:hypothetical protein
VAVTAVPRPRAVLAIAIALGLTAALVLGFVTLSPSSSCTSNCSGIPEPEFVVGHPVAGTCPTGGSPETTGCTAGDFIFNLTVESSSATYGELQFHIETPNGTIYVAPGAGSGFSLLLQNGTVVAYYECVGGLMEMTQGWQYLGGTTSSTLFGVASTVTIDAGSTGPSGPGYEFIAQVNGPASEEALVPLP